MVTSHTEEHMKTLCTILVKYQDKTIFALRAKLLLGIKAIIET